MPSSSVHAAALRKAAANALDDARAAWTASRTSTTEDSVRAALRAGILASRALRKAAGVSDEPESTEMLESAKRVDASVARLKIQLARIIEPL